MSEATIKTDAQEEAPKEKLSTPNHLQLMEYKPEYFGGIRADMNFLFHLADGPVAEFSGDQGLCKTSLLNCLIMLLGGDEAVNSMNVSIKESKRQKQKSASITFKDLRNDKTTYEVRITKTAYSVKKIEVTDGSPVTSLVQSPKEFIRNLFGPIGVSPMILKEKDGKAQIEWLRSLYRLTPDQLKVEAEIKEKFKIKFKERTGVNNSIKSLYSEVVATSYYSWDKENKCFVVTEKRGVDLKNISDNLKDADTITQQMTVAQERVRDRDRGKNVLDQCLLDKQKIEEAILDLQAKLKAKEEELSAITVRIEDGEQYMKKFENVDADFQTVQSQMLNIGDLKVMKSRLENADQKAKDYDTKVEDKIKLTGTLDELKVLKKKFTELFTPKIEGFQVIIDDGIDKSDDENTESSKTEEKLEEGLYFNDRTMQELSESELWGLWANICRSLNVRFLFLENAQDLGSAAAETINSFVKDGYGCVYYTTMVRGQKELQFTINGEFN